MLAQHASLSNRKDGKELICRVAASSLQCPGRKLFIQKMMLNFLWTQWLGRVGPKMGDCQGDTEREEFGRREEMR